MDRLARLKRLMPSLYKPASNPIILGLLSAIAQEDESASTQIDNAKDQIFIKTAVGTYLDYLANNLDVSRPTIINFIDSKFRELIPILSYWPKQVKHSIYKCLELFWSVEYLHSTVTSAAEPFNLVGGENLTLIVDETHTVGVTFLAEDFAIPGVATAEEVVARINAWLPDYVTAYVYDDHILGTTHVKISTNTFGLAGTVQVTGGNANLALGFDTDKHQYTRVSLHELNPNELVVRIPRNIIVEMDTLKWSHRFHADHTIIDSRPVIDSAHPYWPGSFFYDRPGGSSIYLTSTSTTTSQVLTAGINYGIINVVDSSQFPGAGGYVVFDFGLDTQEVVKYLLRPSNNTILLDATHIFQHSHILGTTLHYCMNTPYAPRITGDDYPIFFIDTAVGQQLVQSFILLLKAAGIVVRWIIEDES